MINAAGRFSLASLIFIALLPLAMAAEASGEIDSALLAALQGSDIKTQALAVEQLGTIRNEESFSLLTSMVERKEENWQVRIRAIRLLGEIGDPRSADLLLNVFTNPFLNEECPSIRWTTALALGNFRDDSRVIEALIGALGNNNLMIREAVIQSLGNIRASKAVPFLIPALTDKSFAIRISAVKALSAIGGQDAIPFLRRTAETDRDPFVKNEALSALKVLK